MASSDALPGMAEFRQDQLDFDKRPILVFWESTRACLLACKHCRAEALEQPLPGELSTLESRAFIRTLVDFGRPFPVLIITGGDPLMRPDVFDLVRYARSLGLPVGLAPSVTPRLTPEAARTMREAGIKAMSISMDGATGATHEAVRGVEGHFAKTLDALRMLVDLGFTLQVNTTVMRDNVAELPRLAALLRELKVKIWEVFFLIHVGRGSDVRELSPHECEDVLQFLYDVACRGIHVRTVEAPFFRRIVVWRMHGNRTDAAQASLPAGSLYSSLTTELERTMGPPTTPPLIRSAGTRDGKGIVFVGYDGTIYPAGFLPVSLGNVRQSRLVDAYRDSPLLQNIRRARFSGRCGACEHADLCGGSRSRAYAATGDPLAEDPACAYVPVGMIQPGTPASV